MEKSVGELKSEKAKDNDEETHKQEAGKIKTTSLFTFLFKHDVIKTYGGIEA
jgi:hypothetical protein